MINFQVRLRYHAAPAVGLIDLAAAAVIVLVHQCHACSFLLTAFNVQGTVRLRSWMLSSCVACSCCSRT